MFGDLGNDRWLYPAVDLVNEFGPAPNPGTAAHHCLVNCKDQATEGVRFVKAGDLFDAGGLKDDVDTVKQVKRGDVVLVRKDGQDLDSNVFWERALVFSGDNALASAYAEKQRLFQKQLDEDIVEGEQGEQAEEDDFTVISDWDEITKLFKSKWG